MTTIAAPIQSDSFGTTGKEKEVWTPTSGTNWSDGTAYSDAVPMVDKISFYLWGAAADKTGEDPYKTMNTWYTTNKAAIDAASLASETQVGPWGMYVDLQRNQEDAVIYPDLVRNTAALAANSVCESLVTVGTITTAASQLYYPEVGTFGDSFGFGIKNKTTGAMTPFLVWGAKTTTKPQDGDPSADATLNGAYSVVWDSYDWTPNATITDYSTINAVADTLSGLALTEPASTVVEATRGVAAPFTTVRTCDTNKWAKADSCEGVTKWALDTGVNWTSSSAKGSKRAWIWLADANPSSKSSVFGVEKEDELEITIHQHNAYLGTNSLCELAAAAETKQGRENIWGVATFTHDGASATLLGASAVMAALVSFF